MGSHVNRAPEGLQNKEHSRPSSALRYSQAAPAPGEGTASGVIWDAPKGQYEVRVHHPAARLFPGHT